MNHSRSARRILLLAALPLALLVATSGCRSGSPLWPGTDTLAPTVLSTAPVDGATGVTLQPAITATFSEAMNPSTVTGASFHLTGPGGARVNGTVAYGAATPAATFIPAAALLTGTTYTATVTTAASDLAGHPLAAPAIWTFTTGVAADRTAPTVLSTVAANGATGVALNQPVTATFSEAMDAATITGATFRVTGLGGTSVAGAVAYDAATHVGTFTPAGALAPGTTFTATITTASRDVAGNSLGANKVWTFTTGSAADTTAPTVISTDPANAATGVATNRSVTATFSEAMDAATIAASFTLRGPGQTPVSGAVSYDAPTRTATFTPGSALAPGTTFTATVTTAARDLAGNAMASDRSWTFATGSASDTVAPTVLATVPADGATGIATNQSVGATFSEAMDPSTITGASFTLRGPGQAAVSGAVSYDPATRAVTFAPSSALAAGTTYTAMITTAARDLAGNAMASSKVWTFTTGLAADTTAPTVLSTSPSAGDTQVPVGQAVGATFSEAMNASTISAVTFRLDGPGATPVSGGVSYDSASHVATFTPAGPLAVGTTYTATITTGVRDVASNAMASDVVWSFTTAATSQSTVALGSVSSYAVLAGSTVTSTGPTHLVGDLGVSPGTGVTGFPPGTLTGSIHSGDPAAAAAKSDLDSAYADAAGRTQSPVTVAGNLGGQTLTPGLYKSTSSLAISGGDLTLDAQGDGNGVFIFQMASTLTTTSGRAVILSGGASAANVFWQVGTSATLGTGSAFQGTIMADQSITLNTGATIHGRAVTRIGAVTLDANVITIP